MRSPSSGRVLFGVWLPWYVLQFLLARELHLPVWSYLLELLLFGYLWFVLGRLDRP